MATRRIAHDVEEGLSRGHALSRGAWPRDVAVSPSNPVGRVGMAPPIEACALRDLAQALGLRGAVDAGEDEVAGGDVPRHLRRQVVAASDEGLELGRRARDAGHDFPCDLFGDAVLDLVALGLAD